VRGFETWFQIQIANPAKFDCSFPWKFGMPKVNYRYL
jgi:hypothetical protein